jgi:hypothetical protein
MTPGDITDRESNRNEREFVAGRGRSALFCGKLGRAGEIDKSRLGKPGTVRHSVPQFLGVITKSMRR